jgi:hypothetical protein
LVVVRKVPEFPPLYTDHRVLHKIRSRHSARCTSSLTHHLFLSVPTRGYAAFDVWTLRWLSLHHTSKKSHDGPTGSLNSYYSIRFQSERDKRPLYKTSKCSGRASSLDAQRVTNEVLDSPAVLFHVGQSQKSHKHGAIRLGAPHISTKSCVELRIRWHREDQQTTRLRPERRGNTERCVRKAERGLGPVGREAV